MASGDTLARFMALHNEPPSASAATLDTRNQHPVLDFDAAAHEYGRFSDRMPQIYGGGGVTVYLDVAFSSATSGSAVYEVAFERITAQDMDSDSFATAASVIVAANGTAGIYTTASLSFANGAAMDSVVAGDGYRVQLMRNHDHASDGATGDAEFRFMELRET